MMRRLFIGAVGTALLCIGGIANAVLIEVDTAIPSIVTGIQDLEVDGVLYDVDFTRSREVFDLVFGAGDPPSGLVPTFYYDRAGAIAAATAIAEAFIADPRYLRNVGDAALAAWEVQVPYQYAANPSSYIINASWYINPSSTSLHYDRFARTTTPPSYAGWAIFSPVAVPEPATLALFGVGLALLGLTQRRRIA